MADLIENSVWEENIYQLEETDPVHGGPPDLAKGEGFDNVQAQQLANRTQHLKAVFEALQAAFEGQDIGALIADATADMLTEAQGDARYVLQSAFTAAALLNLIKQVDGAGSGLDADRLDGLSSSQFLRADTNDTMAGALSIARNGHTHLQLGGLSNINPLVEFLGSEGRRGILQAYDDHMALRVYKPDETLISLRIYDDGRITWNGKKLLTEDDNAPDRVDEFAPFPAANASVSVLHGYGHAPSNVQAWAVCVTADGGYAPGDRIKLGTHYRYHVGGMAFGANGTEVFFSAKYLDIITASGAGIVGIAGSSNWKLELISWT
ncbi:hypothetical protein [Thalassobius sp. I31.1]|uniref:hypothetical protein n=1 Tax=Thalassobius sp. I31.1 TaxID=2109912 RepID=UPI000D1AE322|nr:hypothetical protein [Thalassobius sp. I31.1]